MNISKSLKIGNNIKKYRTEKGLSQKELANLLHMPYSTYSNYENGNRIPSQEQIAKIASVLGVKISDILGHISTAQSIKLDDDIYLVAENTTNDFKEAQNRRLLAYWKKLSSLPDLPSEKHVPHEPNPTSDYIISLEDDLLLAFRSLNKIGKLEAVKRLQELSELEKYRSEKESDL